MLATFILITVIYYRNKETENLKPIKNINLCKSSIVLLLYVNTHWSRIFLSVNKLTFRSVCQIWTYLRNGVFLSEVKRSSLLVIPVTFYPGKNLGSWSYDKCQVFKSLVEFEAGVCWSWSTLVPKSRLLNIREF